MTTPTPPSCNQLIQTVLQCAAEYQPTKVTLDSHISSFLIAHPLEPSSASFVTEVLYGVERHRAFLDVVMEGFFARCGTKVARSDRKLFEVFTLLVVFKLKALTLPRFLPFVYSQPPHAMHTLLSFLFDKELEQYFTDMWSIVYDHTYVKETMRPYMHELAPHFAGVITALSDQLVAPVSVQQRVAKPNTVPEPFKLTQPKIPMLPPPTVVPTQTVARDVPSEIYNTSLQQLDRERDERRRQTEEETFNKHKSAKAPLLSTDLRIRPRVANDSSPALFKAQPAPSFPTVAPPKPTAAAILREEARWRKKEDEEKQQLKEYESILRDADEFHEWQLKMEKADEEKKAAMVQQRKEAMAQSAQDAIRAYEKHVEKKHETVLEMREELEAINAEKQKKREEEVKQLQERAKEIAAEKLNIPIAVEAVVKEKKATAAEIMKSKEVNAAKIAREREAEIARRRQLIKEIQAMEKLANARAKRPKEIDPTATAKLGVMSEMSLAELQSRLEVLHKQEEAYLAEKREKIKQDKQKKQEVLKQMEKKISKLRYSLKQEHEQQRKERVETEEKKQVEKKQKEAQSAVIVEGRLAAKREVQVSEALRLAAEIKAKKMENEFYARQKVEAQQARDKDMEAAKRRVEMEEAVRAKQAEELAQHTAFLNEKNRNLVVKQQKRAKAAVRHAADELLEQHRVEAFEVSEEERIVKEFQTQHIKSDRDEQVQHYLERNPYATSIAAREAKRAATIHKRQSQSPPRTGTNVNSSLSPSFVTKHLNQLQLDSDRLERTQIQISSVRPDSQTGNIPASSSTTTAKLVKART